MILLVVTTMWRIPSSRIILLIVSEINHLTFPKHLERNRRAKNIEFHGAQVQRERKLSHATETYPPPLNEECTTAANRGPLLLQGRG